MPKLRARNQSPPPFEGRIQTWSMQYLRKHRWQIAAMCDNDDFQQIGWMLYLQARHKYPKLTNFAGFFRLYRTYLYFYIKTKARQCFPNPYNMGAENRCYSMTRGDGESSDPELNNVFTSTGLEVESYLELLEKLPKELHEAFMLLVREFTGLGRIEIQETVRLNGKMRREDLSRALARAAGFDPNRNVLGEIGQALGVATPDEIGKALSVLSIDEIGWVLSVLPVDEIRKTLSVLSTGEVTEGTQVPCPM